MTPGNLCTLRDVKVHILEVGSHYGGIGGGGFGTPERPLGLFCPLSELGSESGTRSGNISVGLRKNQTDIDAAGVPSTGGSEGPSGKGSLPLYQHRHPQPDHRCPAQGKVDG